MSSYGALPEAADAGSADASTSAAARRPVARRLVAAGAAFAGVALVALALTSQSHSSAAARGASPVAALKANDGAASSSSGKGGDSDDSTGVASGGKGKGSGSDDSSGDDTAHSPKTKKTLHQLLNDTSTDSVTCHVTHGLCDISTCTLSADGETASCGCLRSNTVATIALGWASAIMSESSSYLKVLRDHVGEISTTDDGDSGYDDKLCSAVGEGLIWPKADAVSLWSTNTEMLADDVETIDCEKGGYEANCMGAPCFDKKYPGDESWDLVCVCPVQKKKVVADVKLSRDKNELCRMAGEGSCAVVTPGWHMYGDEELDSLIAKLGSMEEDTGVDAHTCPNNCTYCDHNLGKGSGFLNL